jgi:hypothetical protein
METPSANIQGDYIEVLNLGLMKQDDLSPAGVWLVDRMLCKEGELDYLQEYAQQEGIDFQQAYDELNGQGLIVETEPGWIELPWQKIYRKAK